MSFILFNQPLDATQLPAFEAATVLQPNRLEPELGEIIVPFDMDVNRLIVVPGIE